MNSADVPVAIGLGSNLGRRAENLAFAVEGLGDRLRDLRRSSIYETAPAYDDDNPDFLNMCCTGLTTASPLDLLRELKGMEREAGRQEGGARWSSRPLDLDLLLYGDRIIREEDLRVPHPRMHERGFVLVPLAEIAPEWRHPGSGLTMAELAERVDAGGVWPYPDEA